MHIQKIMKSIKDIIEEIYRPLPAPHPECVVFASISDGLSSPKIVHDTGKRVQDTLYNIYNNIQYIQDTTKIDIRRIKIDVVTHARVMSWEQFCRSLSYYRRNFFRYGVAFDTQFTVALLEQECCANSILYGTGKKERAEFNYEQFITYSKTRFTSFPELSSIKEGPVTLFDTTGIFFDAQGEPCIIPGVASQDSFSIDPGPKADVGSDSALFAGIRSFGGLSHELLRTSITSSSRFLASQMKENGEFVYGYVPGLGRKFTGYNRVRHAGTLFALLAAWEHIKDDTLLPVIKEGVDALANQFVREYTLGSGEKAAFLVEPNDEIKLGGNGVALVTLSRWQELTGNTEYQPLMEGLAAGIEYMQDTESGGFVHVLHAADLSVKEAYRTVYYDGEALFGLMRAYGVVKKERWLESAGRALDVFISLKHWRHHDHWLSYAVNEMTLHRPENRYFRFGLRNVGSHLSFILNRETTYPTLLELCMAAETMIRRLEGMEEKRFLLDEIDLDMFRLASRKRAEYLFYGYYWPEVAMYFKRPRLLEGTFFIRHHAFRTRIDDVGHYLCGLTAYDALFFSDEIEPQIG